MHQKRVFPPPEIIPALPELVDFKGIPKKNTRQGIFEDPDFPATNASLGGVLGGVATCRDDRCGQQESARNMGKIMGTYRKTMGHPW